MARPGDDFDRDILDIIPERFDADADSHQARVGHRLRTGITLFFAVAAVGGIVAGGLHFLGGKQKGGPGIPVIRADDRPLKVRPDDRGGMQVPNQDKLVYERMEGGDGDPKVERLLPQAEVPKNPPRGQGAPTDPVSPKAATPEILKPPSVTKKGEPSSAKAAPQPQVAAEPAIPLQPAPAPVAAPVAVQPTKPAPAPVPQPAVAAPPIASARAAPPSGDYVIQLGAVRAQDLAEKEWTRIQKTNHDLLGALKPDIVRVELEGKGTYWRVRAGPLSEQAARQMCQELATRSQGCIVGRK